MGTSSSHPAVFAAFDGGGSGTRALIATEDGALLALGRAGPSNPNVVGATASAAALNAAWTNSWANAEAKASPVSSAFFGVAGGALWTQTGKSEALTDWLPRVSGAPIQLDHDLRVALAGGLSGRSGVVLVAGTGSAGFARNDQGQTERCGGGGPLIDDAGSGYWLGLAALRETHRAFDGRVEASGLSRAIASVIGASNAAGLVRCIHQVPTTEQRPEIAALATVVLEQARAGDLIARRLRDAGADELARIAMTLSKKLFSRTVPEFVVSGGLSQDSEYMDAVRMALQDHLATEVKLNRAEHPPIVGGLILAFAACGKTPKPELLRAADAVVMGIAK